MEYQCRTVNLNKMLLSHKGPIDSLCTRCKSEDCGNPIEIRKISFFGIAKEHRFFVRSGEPMAVVQCEGYSE